MVQRRTAHWNLFKTKPAPPPPPPMQSWEPLFLLILYFFCFCCWKISYLNTKLMKQPPRCSHFKLRGCKTASYLRKNVNANVDWLVILSGFFWFFFNDFYSFHFCYMYVNKVPGYRCGASNEVMCDMFSIQVFTWWSLLHIVKYKKLTPPKLNKKPSNNHFLTTISY